jgi:uncharacterized Ntn-hydrolase superfamily protein
MAEAFRARIAGDLAECLMVAIEAGRKAGGQHGLDCPLPERSAHLLVHEADEHPAIDLRVDSHPDAVTELRRLLEEFRPHIPFYRQRWKYLPGPHRRTPSSGRCRPRGHVTACEM